MADIKQNTKKVVTRKYKVIKLSCEYCGEEKYYIIPCPHCGEPLSCNTTLEMSLDEIQELLAKGVDIDGLQHIKELGEDDSFNPNEPTEDLKGISPDEIDMMFDPDDWGL